MRPAQYRAPEAPARRPAVTRSQAAASRALAELPALHDQDADELRVYERALDVCRRLRDAEVGTVAFVRAVLDACAVADEVG